MPIPKELRHLYRGKAYEAFRNALLDRAGNACEQCKAPNGMRVFRVSLKEFAGWWWSEGGGIGHDERGNSQPAFSAFAVHEFYRAAVLDGFRKREPDWRGVKIVLTAAHLNRVAGDDRPENGKMLCQMCHLNYDRPVHLVHSRETRCAEKDPKRPLLALLEVSA
jgi:hypothetical protein